jgi:hypothetical protein
VLDFTAGLALVVWALSCWLLLISMAPRHWLYMLVSGGAYLALRDWGKRIDRP